MGDERKAYLMFLENRNYRCLQQLAKSLDLPSNFKKVYLIELLDAKKYRSEDVVKTIIQRVRIERLLNAKNRSKRYKKKKFSLSSRTRSPPISATPKRVKANLPLSAIEKIDNTRRSLLNVMEQQNTSPKPSDRVLRSYNLRRARTLHQNRALVSETLACENKVQHEVNTKAVIQINMPTGNMFKYYLNSESVVKKHRPAILNSSCNSEARRPLILKQRDVGVQSNITALRRHRTVSGIYSLPATRTYPQSIQNVQTTEGVSMRNNDGSVTKINALIQKNNTNYNKKITYCNTEINLQDLIDSIDDNIENSDSNMQLPAIGCNRRNSPSILYPYNETQYSDPASNAYSYQLNRLRYQRMYNRSSRYTNEPVLPKISEVFSKMNNIKNISQPLYVQVSTESELSQSHPLFAENCNTSLLESLYNFKNQMLTNVPLLQVATTANTKSIYSTSTVTTAREHHSASHGIDLFNYNPYEQDNRYGNDPRLYEFFRYSQQHNIMQQDTAFNLSSSSTETLQECSTPATIPEMLEDAVELISQDGDYMEQIGMDVRVPCVLCDWAGPNILLENHIQKEHRSCVVECGAGVSVSWSLAALSRACVCVLRRGGALYVLRARTSDPDLLSAQLTTISVDPAPRMGEITVYNKRTGEPYSWMGYIQPLGQDDAAGLQVNISQLDLLPNSANLKLLNRELVSYSLNKVVVGAPALNDITVSFNIKIE